MTAEQYNQMVSLVKQLADLVKVNLPTELVSRALDDLTVIACEAFTEQRKQRKAHRTVGGDATASDSSDIGHTGALTGHQLPQEVAEGCATQQ